MGAEPLDLREATLERFATDSKTFSGGFDITVDASGKAETIPQLIVATARGGVSVSTAGMMYRKNPVATDVSGMYRKSVSFHTGCVHTHTFIDEPLEFITS